MTFFYLLLILLSIFFGLVPVVAAIQVGWRPLPIAKRMKDIYGDYCVKVAEIVWKIMGVDKK